MSKRSFDAGLACGAVMMLWFGIVDYWGFEGIENFVISVVPIVLLQMAIRPFLGTKED